MSEVTNSLPEITILGCGYVGLTTAAILAQAGYQVTAVEPNPGRLAIIQSGRSFFFEAGLDALVKAGIDSGRLVATDSYDSTARSQVVFSCVGTPDNPDGSSNLSYVHEAAEQSAKRMADGSVYVQKSTVPVGTGAELTRRFFKPELGIAYISNPEFLSESTAVADTLWPARVVTGGDSQDAATQVLDIYHDIERHATAIATLAGIATPADGLQTEYLYTTLSSAELIKVSSNAFLALKISFANSIAKLADVAGADITEVMAAVGADPRIGRQFLNAGRGYGGGCFPKDVSGLIRSAKDHGVALPIMMAVSEVNASMPHYCVQRATELLDDNLEDKRIVVLGLAFKAGTSDTRRSPAVTIANTLYDQGASVVAYDPAASEEAKPELQAGIKLVDSLPAALPANQTPDAVIIATNWPEFNKDLLALLAASSQPLVLLDCMNSLNPADIPPHVTYSGIGRAKQTA